MATINSTQALYGPVKAGHIGTQCLNVTMTGTAASSVGDVLNVAKLPRGAKLESIEVYGACIGTLLTFSVGDEGSATRHGTLSLTATSTYKTPTTMGLGYTYSSISADANDWLLKFTVATATSISSTGYSFTAQIRYHMD